MLLNTNYNICYVVRLLNAIWTRKKQKSQIENCSRTN